MTETIWEIRIEEGRGNRRYDLLKIIIYTDLVALLIPKYKLDGVCNTIVPKSINDGGISGQKGNSVFSFRQDHWSL
jgi:hypothetical protein